MKNPKTFMLLSVIVAVLVLGVVYAALTSDLTITANATVAPDSSNFNVAFTNSVVTKIQTLGADATTSNSSLVTTGQSAQTSTLTVAAGALKKVGDYVTVTYTVTNSSVDLNAKLGEITVTDEENSQYIKFSAEYGTPATTTLTAGGGTNTVVVTATLVKAPSDANVTATANINFTATSAEA